MSFLLRSARPSDVGDLYNLSTQFTLLNLPSDKKVLAEKVECSEQSFSGQCSREDAHFMFVAEDVETKNVAGCSVITAQKGTPKQPSYSFEVLKKERFSPDLGVGFIHQILRLKIETDGSTEVGGLIVDGNYRRRPEKIGRQISLIRFLYLGCFPDKFKEDIHAELAPPLTDEGRSEFWESLGRRFTGMPYQEADALSGKNKEFIRSLFPEEDIYLCLLDPKARLVMGRVSVETEPALHMLKQLGFEYKNEVDPFDGGPHVGAKLQDLEPIKNMKKVQFQGKGKGPFQGKALLAAVRDNDFVGGMTSFHLEGNQLVIPETDRRWLPFEPGEDVIFYPLPDGPKRMEV